MRRAVAAEHDLLLRVVQRVERVEELGLRPFLADDELDVVDEQDVHAAVPLAEFENAVVPNRVDDLVHEAFGRDVRELQPRAVRQDVVADRVHQMGLAQTDAAVEEQRVVRTRRRFSHRAAGRVRELIRRADDERVEGVAGTQAADARVIARPSALGLGQIRDFRLVQIVRPAGLRCPPAESTTVAPARPTSANASAITPV